MLLTDIPHLRLANQQLLDAKISKPAALVKWMGCIQAQDYAGAKWAIGNRIPGITDVQVEAALDKGEILRTHILRPTWHFVAPQDIGWMLQLTSPGIKAMSLPYQRKLGIDAQVLKNSRAVIVKELAGNNFLTRDELAVQLARHKIDTGDTRLGFLLMDAELDGIICSGPRKENKFTYALLAERVPHITLPGKEAAIAALAKIYFQSHGPATLQDFAWWSGCSVAESKMGVELNKNILFSEMIGNKTYWSVKRKANAAEQRSLFLLPPWDEYTVAYKDRSAVLPADCIKPTGNGIFKPVIVVDGQVAGTWQRTMAKDKVSIALSFINKTDRSLKDLAQQQALRYKTFLGYTHADIRFL